MNDAPVDLDGDGRTDLLYTYNLSQSPDTSRFVVQLATGYTHELDEDVFTGISPPEFLGTLDLDRDGTDEAFVHYPGGASTSNVRVLAFSDCRLVSLGEFLIGGGANYGYGLACPFDDADLVDYDAQLNNTSDGYVVGWRRHRIAGATLKRVDEQSGVEVPLDDPMVSAAYGLDCGDLEAASYGDPLGPSTSEWTVFPAGVGPIEVGMVFEEAVAASGTEFELWEPLDDYSCHSATGTGPADGIVLMMSNFEIVRIDFQSETFRTVEGVGVGSREAEVLTAYGDQVSKTPGEYGNWYLTVEPDDPNLLVRFEVSPETATVTHFRVGLTDWVELVEGCA